MTAYEIKQETSAFQLGYWDAFSGREDPFPPRPTPSERIDYRRGYRMGLQDFRSGH